MGPKRSEIGRKIKQARELRGFSRDALAEKSGVSAATIKRLEAEELGISMDAFLNLLDAMQLPADVVLGGSEAAESQPQPAIRRGDLRGVLDAVEKQLRGLADLIRQHKRSVPTRSGATKVKPPTACHSMAASVVGSVEDFQLRIGQLRSDAMLLLIYQLAMAGGKPVPMQRLSAETARWAPMRKKGFGNLSRTLKQWGVLGSKGRYRFWTDLVPASEAAAIAREELDARQVAYPTTEDVEALLQQAVPMVRGKNTA